MAVVHSRAKDRVSLSTASSSSSPSLALTLWHELPPLFLLVGGCEWEYLTAPDRDLVADCSAKHLPWYGSSGGVGALPSSFHTVLFFGGNADGCYYGGP